MNDLKRVAAIHDLSGYGKCSLTVVMPVMSAMGIEVCPVPTALLSTHTAGFTGYTFNDLTEDMEGFLNHWKTIDLNIDCIYSGFLGSERQIDIVCKYIDTFKGAIVAVDPVMGDNGKIYATYNEEMCRGMRLLASRANIVVPNLTEAAYILDEKYPESGTLDKAAALEWLKKLCDMGPDTAVLTGLTDGEDIFNAGYQKATGELTISKCKRIPGNFHGTGDLYSSILIGCLMKGDSLKSALDKATEFVYICAKDAHDINLPTNLGVRFEKYMKELVQF